MPDNDKKMYVCESCAIELGVSTDTPYMRHICEKCGDGPCDLFEVDAKKPDETPVQEGPVVEYAK